MQPPEGLLLVDKPGGPTSHDIVQGMRRITGQRKIGHAGTLDPMATGLLPLVLGRATRLVRFLHHSPKLYEGSFLLGRTTSTDDITGEVLETHDGEIPGQPEVLDAVLRFRGTIAQIPPAVSARKIGGQRMYRLARKGEKVEAPPREVVIDRFDLTPSPDREKWFFRAEVSGGTYIRSLVRDLGKALGCGGALASLRRLSIGPMTIEDAIPYSSAQEGETAAMGQVLIPLDSMPLDLPPHTLLDRLEIQRFLSGAPIWTQETDRREETVRVLGPGGEILGVADAIPGQLQPRVVLK